MTDMTEPSGAEMPTAGRDSSLDERLFPTIDVLERPLGDRPQHQTLESIMDWLAGPATALRPPNWIVFG
jgi:hypothetical protein